MLLFRDKPRLIIAIYNVDMKDSNKLEGTIDFDILYTLTVCGDIEVNMCYNSSSISIIWCIEGEFCRKRYKKNEKRHRVNKPAFISRDNLGPDVKYYIYNMSHRVNGAILWSNSIDYYHYGLLNRYYGPVRIWPS